MLKILSETKDLYFNLNLVLKNSIKDFYRKKVDRPSVKSQMLLLAQSTHINIAKLRTKVEKLQIPKKYSEAYKTLNTTMYCFECASFCLVDGMRTLSQTLLNEAGEHTREAIKLSEKTVELCRRMSAMDIESSEMKFCPECVGKWKRIVDNYQIIAGCGSCGYSEIEGELPAYPSGIRDHWNGVIDNIERIVEAKVSKRGWTF